MTSRYLIDDVCLWCARVFAGLNTLSVAGVAPIAFAPARWHRWMALDSLRACEITAVLALSILWIISIWTLRNNTSRLFLALSAALYLILAIWSISQGYGFTDSSEAAFTVTAFIGLLSMIWVAIRPPMGEALRA